MYAQVHYTCMQMGLLLKLCTHVRIDLCRRHPRNLACPPIVATWYSTLKLNLAAARFRGNTVTDVAQDVMLHMQRFALGSIQQIN